MTGTKKTAWLGAGGLGSERQLAADFEKVAS